MTVPAPKTAVLGARIFREFRRGFALLWLVSQLPAGAAETTPLTLRWTFPTQSWVDNTPALAPDGTIYFGTFHGRFFAVASDGTERWLFKTGLEIQSSPAVAADGTICFGSRDRRVYALDPQGQRKWAFKTGGWVDASPALGRDGSVYVGSWDRHLYALTPAGRERWKVLTGGPVTSSAAIGLDGTLYFGSHDGGLYAVSPAGLVRWKFITRGPVLSSPALSGGEGVFFTSADGHLYAVGFDGQLRWRTHTGGCTASSPVIAADGSLVVGVNQSVCAFDGQGKRLWERPGGNRVDGSAAIGVNGIAYVADQGGHLLALDANGVASSIAALHMGHSASLTLSAEGLVFAGQRGLTLSAFAAAPLARTSWPKFRGNLRNTGNLADQP